MRLLFSLCAIITVGCASLFAGSGSAVDPTLLNLIPGNTRVVFGIEVAQARTSPFGQFVLSQMNDLGANDEHFQQFVEQTGFDPRQDVDQLLFVSNGDRTHPQFAVLARATFDKDKMEAAATAKGAALEHFQDIDILVEQGHRATRSGSPAAHGLAFLDAGVVVAGDLDTVHEVIANRSTPSNPDMRLLNQINVVSASNDAWFVSTVPGSDFAAHFARPSEGKNFSQSQALQTIVESSGGVKFGDQVSISADAIARTAQDATSLGDVVRFLASMAQMQRENADPRAAIVAKAIDSMTITSSGDTLHITLSFPEKDLEQLAQAKSARQRY